MGARGLGDAVQSRHTSAEAASGSPRAGFTGVVAALRRAAPAAAALALVAGACATTAESTPTAAATDSAARTDGGRVTAKVVASDYVYVAVPAAGPVWRIVLQRKRGAKWVKQQAWRSRPAEPTRTVDAPKGVYRVKAVPRGGGSRQVVAVGKVSDRRPAAKRLRPSPQTAYRDYPASYLDDCHAPVAVDEAELCSYGDTAAAEAVLMFGDSQLAQWLAAVDAAGRALGVRIDYATKSSCPASDATVGVEKPARPYGECDRWRADLIQQLDSGPAYRLALVGDFERYDLFDRGSGKALAGSAGNTEWAQAASRTAEALAPHAERIVWVRGIQDLVIDPPQCLRDNPRDISACDRLSKGLLDSAQERWEAKTGALADLPVTAVADLTGTVCPYGVCTVNAKRIAKYRDRYHLTNTFSARLAPAMRRILEQYS